FFQAEDGIRDFHVTGVQTCALPILLEVRASIPLGIVVHQLSPALVLGLAFVGSSLVPVIILPFLDSLINWIKSLHDKLGEYAQRSEERRVGKECRTRGGEETQYTRD